MSELRALIAAVRELRAAGQPFVSATVTAVNGSGYRKAGARMVATQDQWQAGSISGGCLERDVTNKGLWYTRHERACTVRYDRSEDEAEEGTGTGCQGVVDVLIERHERELAVTDVFAAAERCLRDETSAVVITVVRSSRAELPLAARLILQADEWLTDDPELRRLFATEAQEALASRRKPYLLERAGLTVLIECLLPPVHLLVFGSSHDAGPLVTHAKNLGWTVSVWDASPRSSARERFQLADHYLTGDVSEAVALAARAVRGAAVVMGHHFARDRAALAALLASNTPYIGILGARLRTQQLREACHATAADPRIHAPIGLPIGPETPAEIALAIVAEIQASFAQPTRAR